MLCARKYQGPWCRSYYNKVTGKPVTIIIPATTEYTMFHYWRIYTKEMDDYFEEWCFENDGDFVDNLLRPSDRKKKPRKTSGKKSGKKPKN